MEKIHLRQIIPFLVFIKITFIHLHFFTIFHFFSSSACFFSVGEDDTFLIPSVSSPPETEKEISCFVSSTSSIFLFRLFFPSLHLFTTCLREKIRSYPHKLYPFERKLILFLFLSASLFQRFCHTLHLFTTCLREKIRSFPHKLTPLVIKLILFLLLLAFRSPFHSSLIHIPSFFRCIARLKERFSLPFQFFSDGVTKRGKRTCPISFRSF